MNEAPAGASLVAQLVKNLPAMQATLVSSLGQEDPLEKEMATHSSILAWEIPWTEDRGAWWAVVHGVTRVEHGLVTKPSAAPAGLRKDQKGFSEKHKRTLL